MSDEHDYTMRLQRFLARAGVASRRGSETLMTAGRVRVNGHVAREMGTKVTPAIDVVEVDGRRVTLSDEHTYLVLYKPSGYLTTMSDPYGRPCVARLVPLASHPGLYPVGRLDEDTTGLLFFTTDGTMGQRLLHPSHHVWKRYVALVRGCPKEQALNRLRKGIALDDGPAQPAEVSLLKNGDPRALPVAPEGVPHAHAVVMLRIHEGRKHQVKRMLKAIGHEVVRLHRDEFGPLVLGDIMPGTWRLCSPDEVNALRACTQD